MRPEPERICVPALKNRLEQALRSSDRGFRVTDHPIRVVAEIFRLVVMTNRVPPPVVIIHFGGEISRIFAIIEKTRKTREIAILAI